MLTKNVSSKKNVENPNAKAHRIVWLSSLELPEWDKFVRNHPQGTVYHLSNWKRAVEMSFSHIQGEVVALRDSETGVLIGGVPVYTVRSWLLGKRLVCAPFATRCDPLLSVGSVDAAPGEPGSVISALLLRLNAIKADRLEVRTCRPDALSSINWTAQEGFKHHYIELRPDLDELLNTFSRSNVRKRIRKSEREGVRIRRGTTQTDFLSVCRHLFSTRKRLGLPPFPERFLLSLYQCFDPVDFCFFVAERGEENIGGLVAFQLGRRFMLEHLGYDFSCQHLGVSQALYWAAIRYAATAGCKTVSLGRTNAQHEGLMTYKEHWGAKEEDLVYLRYSCGNNRRGFLLKTNGTSFFRQFIRVCPEKLCRVISHLFFRHWS